MTSSSSSSQTETQFLHYCEEIVHNFFPDCVELRKECLRNGYFPPKHRADLYCLVLNSALLQEDNEVKEGETTRKDIIEVFCKRTNRRLEHLPELGDVLSPFVSSSSPLPLPKASSCFYTFCNRQLPLYLLSQETHRDSLVADKLSSLIRVLTLYHFPRLAIHLGSIAPDWALLCADPVDASVTNGRIIPKRWLGCLFAGTVVHFPDNVLRLWDWCICLGEKFVGVYLAVCLLGLHEDALRKINSLDELQEWLSVICRGGIQAIESCEQFKDKLLVDLNYVDSNALDPCNESRTNSEITNRTDSNADEDNEEKTEHSDRGGPVKESDYDDYDEGDDEDDDEDDDFRLETNNLSKMNEIHSRTSGLEEDEKLSSSWQSEEGSSNVEDLMSVSWHNRNQEQTEGSSKEDHVGQEKKNEVNAEKLELIFLTGWLHGTLRLIQNTPITFRSALRSVVDDVEKLLETKRSHHLKLRWSSDSQEGMLEESDLDDTRHGFTDDVVTEDTTSDDYSMENYEEECGSEYSGNSSVPSSPMLPMKDTPADEEDTKGFSKYGLKIFNKGLSLLVPKESQPTSTENSRPLLPTTPRKWLQSGYRHVPCVGTSAEEVLPCICSNRRIANADTSNDRLSISQKFYSGAIDCLHVLQREESVSHVYHDLFPPPFLVDRADDELFFFAIDCWPDDAVGEEDTQGVVSSSGRLCKIPKAIQFSYNDVMNAEVIENILQILDPIAGSVHIVLIGEGSDLIRCRRKSETSQEIHNNIHEHAAQIGALALTLIKHGIPHVSILDGGYGSVLRCFWNCEHQDDNESQNNILSELSSLSFDFLFDVDHDAIRELFVGVEENISEFVEKRSEIDTESSTLLGGDKIDKYNDDFESNNERRKDNNTLSSAYFSEMVSSSGSTVKGMTDMLSKNLFKFS